MPALSPHQDPPTHAQRHTVLDEHGDPWTVGRYSVSDYFADRQQVHPFAVDVGRTGDFSDPGTVETRHAHYDRHEQRFVCEWVDKTDSPMREHDQAVHPASADGLRTVGAPADVVARLTRDAARTAPGHYEAATLADLETHLAGQVALPAQVRAHLTRPAMSPAPTAGAPVERDGGATRVAGGDLDAQTRAAWSLAQVCHPRRPAAAGPGRAGGTATPSPPGLSTTRGYEHGGDDGRDVGRD
ncbi:hypothetical protein [Cellulomonas marina]|uniref:Uncharacterized protein n=1 Tax=Cellulomonas marina TaxID=988821 RepID=A0A1I0YZH2_9CELL|nr:hypothetical protein [Cellulomonas marina]GIG28062.1 hypothetical protein Cma02nite_06620 [Cellulomonas marina]SFB17618.1 hypothetical protein SAMN05421867_1095 [Cellulomonas marina]